MPDEPLDLEAIDARADAATPGPWEHHRWTAADYGVCHIELNLHIADRRLVQNGELVGLREQDAAFISAARVDVPMLTARVRALEAELAALKGE